MALQIRFFASLRESLGHAECAIPAEGIATVAAAWARACPDRTLPANCLAAVNLEYVGLDHPVRDGDEIAFFPPVTGG